MNPFSILLGDIGIALIATAVAVVLFLSLALITHWMDK